MEGRLLSKQKSAAGNLLHPSHIKIPCQSPHSVETLQS